MIFTVEVSTDVFEDVTARFFRVVDGALMFYSESSAEPASLVAGFGPGHWITVSRDDASA